MSFQILHDDVIVWRHHIGESDPEEPPPDDTRDIGLITRPSSSGYGTRLTGDFSGKAGLIPETHPVARITRLGSGGYGVRRRRAISPVPPVENSIPMPETTGGGPSMPLHWYHGQKSRPNWYDYPEGEERSKEEKEYADKLLAEIKRLEEKIEELQTAEPSQKPPPDGIAVANNLSDINKTLQGFLLVAQANLILTKSKSDDDKEERELMELLKDL